MSDDNSKWEQNAREHGAMETKIDMLHADIKELKAEQRTQFRWLIWSLASIGGFLGLLMSLYASLGR